jgi:hypothetical protein
MEVPHSVRHSQVRIDRHFNPEGPMRVTRFLSPTLPRAALMALAIPALLALAPGTLTAESCAGDYMACVAEVGPLFTGGSGYQDPCITDYWACVIREVKAY